MLNFLVGLLAAIMMLLVIVTVAILIEKGYNKLKDFLGRYLPIEKIIEVIITIFYIGVLLFLIYLFSLMFYLFGEVILQII